MAFTLIGLDRSCGDFFSPDITDEPEIAKHRFPDVIRETKAKSMNREIIDRKSGIMEGISNSR